MEQLAQSISVPRTEAEYESAITGYIDQIDRLRLLMARDDAEINRLQTETRTILAELKAA